MLPAGVRRIEAVTGESALAAITQCQEQLDDLCGALKASPNNVLDKASAMRVELRELEKEVARLKQKLATSVGR